MLFAYILFINGITFLLYGADKWLAIRGGYRISEKTLLILAGFGGAFGAYIGMWIFRHKIRKIKFLVGIPIILLLQIGLFLVSYYD